MSSSPSHKRAKFDQPQHNEKEKAKRKLNTCFRQILARNGHVSQYLSEQILKLLRAHPELAATRFQCFPFSEPEYPLTFMLQSDLSTVKQVYELNPRVIREENSTGDLLLHHVCRYKDISRGVIEFLARAYPEAVRKNGFGGFLPIQRLLQKTSPPAQLLETIEVLLDLYPESVAVYDNFSGGNCLNFALRHGHDEKTVEYIIDKLSVFDNEELQIDLHCNLNLSMVTYFSKKILPKLKFFQFHAKSVELGAWTHLLEVLETNKNITKLDLRIPVTLIQEADSYEMVAESIQRLLKNNGTIEEFCICKNRSIGNGWEVDPIVRVLHTIRHYLPSNLVHLKLGGFYFTKNSTFCNLLQDLTCVKSLSLEWIHVGGGGLSQPTIQTSTDAGSCQHKKSSIHKLQLINITFDNTTGDINSFLSIHIANLPLLKIIELEVPFRDIDITEGLMNILHKGQSVQKMILENTGIDIDKLCAALKAQKTLKTLDLRNNLTCREKSSRAKLANVLRDHNTTLEEIVVPLWTKDCQESQRIAYYGKLNRYGIGKTRDPSTSCKELVRLLCAVHNSQEPIQSKTNLRYALLRETPSIWLCPPRCTKMGAVI